MDTPLLDTALYTAPVSPANQDRGFIDSVHHVFGVFDGMAGERGGDMAAEIAKLHIEEALRTLPQPLSLEEGKIVCAMMLRDATEAIYRRAQELQNAMATTASICLLTHTKEGSIVAVVGNVGDSRVYALDPEGCLQQITLDDGPIRFAGLDDQAARAVQAKLNNAQDATSLSSQEIRFFRDRHLMTQVLGDEDMTPRIHTLTVGDGWSLLLTTDGVHDNLTDNEMREIVCTIVNAYEGVHTLIERATQRSREGGVRAHQDDMTALLIRIGKSASMTPAPTRAEEKPSILRSISGRLKKIIN